MARLQQKSATAQSMADPNGPVARHVKGGALGKQVIIPSPP
jgi:hypothetical protein